jgi:hypothetical protein
MMLLLLSLNLPQLAVQLRPSEAAIPVVEVGPQLAATQTTAVQTTITAVQAVLIVANQILELTAMEGILDIAEDLAVTAEIIGQAEALGFELASLEAQITTLFALDAAPITSHELFLLSTELRRVTNENYLFAMRAQTLIGTALRTIEHILSIIEHAGQAIGNLSISQTLSEAQSKLQQLLLEGNVRQAAFERAKSVEGAATTIQVESLHRINERRMADHPRP